MHEVSKCAEINCPSFDSLHFPQEDVNFEIYVLQATVWKLSFISLDMPTYKMMTISPHVEAKSDFKRIKILADRSVCYM